MVLTGPDHVLAALAGPLSGAVAEAEALEPGEPAEVDGSNEVTMEPLDDGARLRLVLQPADTGSAAQALLGDGAADAMLWAVPMIDRQAEAVVAHDALVAVVAPGNATDSLTREQLAGILSGEITDWAELGGPGGEIRLVGLPAGHPVTALRDTLLMSSSGKKPAAPTVMVETTAAEFAGLCPAAQHVNLAAHG